MTNPDSQTFCDIASLKDGMTCNLEVQVVGLSKGYEPRTKQFGVISDQTGAIKFINWVKSELPELELSQWYRLETILVQSYNHLLTIRLTKVTIVRKIPPKCELMAELICIAGLEYGIASFEAKVLDDSIPHAGYIRQKGWFGDGLGFRVPFTIWGSGRVGVLIVGQQYRIGYAIIDHYKGHKDVILDPATVIEIDNDPELSDSLYDYAPIDDIPRNPGSHKPCEYILGAMCSNCESKQITIEKYLESLKTPIESLNNRFRSRQIINYDDPEIQSAYMVRYFPFYVETNKFILKTIDPKLLNANFKDQMTICLYGCGPGPELLGILGFIKESDFPVKNVNVNYYDRHLWEPWKSYCSSEISKDYWSGTIFSNNSYQIDLLELVNHGYTKEAEPIRRADLHCIQNCLSDLQYSSIPDDIIVKACTDLIQMMRPGAILIISDQNLTQIRRLLNLLETEIIRLNQGDIIKRSNEYECHPPDFSIPIILRGIVLERKANLYYSLVVVRK